MFLHGIFFLFRPAQITPLCHQCTHCMLALCIAGWGIMHILVVRSSFSWFCGAERLSCYPQTDQILLLFTLNSSTADLWFPCILWQPLNDKRETEKDKPVRKVSFYWRSTSGVKVAQQLATRYDTNTLHPPKWLSKHLEYFSLELPSDANSDNCF